MGSDGHVKDRYMLADSVYLPNTVYNTPHLQHKQQTIDDNLIKIQVGSWRVFYKFLFGKFRKALSFELIISSGLMYYRQHVFIC